MKNITVSDIESFDAAYESRPSSKLIHNALYKLSISDLAFIGDNMIGKNFNFSIDIKTLPAANQKASGRCWLFAATNLLRERVAKEKNLENFELSQAWLAFWDKFERANYYLESIIELIDRDTDDRTLSFIIQNGVSDGGQWDMFVNVIEKYGILPKDNFPDNAQSSSTGQMNNQLNVYLKSCTAKLRRLYKEGASLDTIQSEKAEMIKKIYVFLVSCYGKPPKTFDFSYVDKDKEYHIEKDLTPVSFREKYIGNLMDEIVSIIHAPTQDKPYHKTYTVQFLGNVVGGKPVKHLNLTMDEFKQAIIAQLKAGKVVWFGSDVGKYGDREKGVWDDQSYNAELLTGLDLTLSKEDALDYSFSAMNHAMVITGVNIEDGKPTRWKIENSWGDKNGAKGYYLCSDTWFDEYVFQAAVEKEYLGNLAALADTEPVELAPWDPMGTLA